MQTLEDLVYVLSAIEKVSRKIIVKYVKYMKDISQNESPLVQEHSKGKSYDETQRMLFDLCTARVKDAQAAIKEIPRFREFIANGKMKQEVLMKECPFLAPVWLGDMYDAKRLAGLKALHQDLEAQLQDGKDQKFD